MLHALAWLGRHGAAAIAIGVFTGLVVPPLAGLLQPLLVPGIVLPFLVALIRLDWGHLLDLVARPLWLLLAVGWLLVALPLIVHPLIGLLQLEAPLHAAMVLLAASPPLMASAATALLLGLDAAQAILLTVAASALVPFTLPGWRWRCSGSRSRSRPSI